MNELEKALLWVVYEQCVYGGKAYAKLLIHGEDAFKALGLKDGCDASEIENRLFYQEAKMHGSDSGMCEICSFYERAMPIKPHYNARTNWYECGACHYSMTSGMHCRSELIPAYKVGFCAKCGKAVKWE